MNRFEYTIIRSSRKSVSINIDRKGNITVRAPHRVSIRRIEAIMDSKSDWIEKTLSNLPKADESETEKLNERELKDLTEAARKAITRRVEYYAPLVGVTYNRISIRHQHTRWGSCSKQGNLNFNCLLVLMPPEVLDSIVVHELCHRLEMNHSKAFYDHVLRVYPDYKKWHKWLNEHGRKYLDMI